MIELEEVNGDDSVDAEEQQIVEVEVLCDWNVFGGDCGKSKRYDKLTEKEIKVIIFKGNTKTHRVVEDDPSSEICNCKLKYKKLKEYPPYTYKYPHTFKSVYECRDCMVKKLDNSVIYIEDTAVTGDRAELLKLSKVIASRKIPHDILAKYNGIDVSCKTLMKFSESDIQPVINQLCIEEKKKEIPKEPPKWLINKYDKYLFDDVFGHGAIKDQLFPILRINIEKEDVMIQRNITPRNSALLYGIPGVGKDMIAHATANEVMKYFKDKINVRKVELNAGKILGDNNSISLNIEKYFDEIAEWNINNNGYTILIIKEIEFLLPNRDGRFARYEERANTFLKILDVIKRTFIMGTTNRPHKLDSAFYRHSRFGEKIKVNPLFENDLKLMIEKTLRSKLSLQDTEKLEQFLVLAKGFVITGDDIEGFITNFYYNNTALVEDNKFCVENLLLNISFFEKCNKRNIKEQIKLEGFELEESEGEDLHIKKPPGRPRSEIGDECLIQVPHIETKSDNEMMQRILEVGNDDQVQLINSFAMYRRRYGDFTVKQKSSLIKMFIACNCNKVVQK